MSESRIQWTRIPVDKQVLSNLNQRRDLPGLLQCSSLLLLFGLTAAGCCTAWQSGNVALTLGAFILHGTITSFFGPPAAVHELSHGTPFKNQKLNEFFIRIFSFISWTDFVFFRASHAWHHRVTLHRGQDKEVIPPLKVKIAELFWMATTFQKAGMLLRHCFGTVNGEYETELFPPDNRKAREALFRWSRILVGGHAALALVFALTNHWILIPVLLAPLYSGWLAVLITFPQHAGLKPDVNDFRASCRTMKLNPLFRYLYWNMNYHTEHHMYPAVPFWKLPELYRLLKTEMPPPNSGLIDAWREIFAIQKQRTTDPDYYFDARLRKGKNS